ncbi:MAG: replicative DNA helicase [Gallicola sp.]|uniref:replicative DNA helicase n=1 Tax=Gallicola sp. Sow4_E12 TaxID=3438785 RepID=UPI0017C73E3E|nr:replicative DNA helicase [Gallicola sp.]
MDGIERKAPYDLNAEASVLGSMILDKHAVDVASELLTADDFYKGSHGDIFRSIQTLGLKGEPVDYLTLSEELTTAGKLEMVGGLDYLMDLSSSVVLTANIRSYCQIVKDKSILRKLIHSSDGIMEKAYSNEPVGSVIEYAESSIYEISQGNVRGGLQPLKEIVGDTMSQIEQMSMNDGGLTGITTGLRDLNSLLSGFQKSDLVLIAARPAMGKTSLALNMALSAALEKHSIAIFSLEMSKMQLTQRLLSSITMIDLQDIISGQIKDWAKLGQGMSILSGLDIYVDDTSGISLTELRSKCRRLSAKSGLQMVMIDYLQLMSGEGRTENRQQEISNISRGLKALAKDLNCPIIALSQLSRAPEQRSDHRPIMSDLRESGAIEQDADLVMMIYRDDYYHEDSEKPNTAELIVTKHRNGPTGTVELFFNKKMTKFSDLISEEVAQRYGE